MADGKFSDKRGFMALHLQLILGGARSGKSRYALNQGNEPDFQNHFFVATAYAGDKEMKDRIQLHRLERSSFWTTIEEPYHLANALLELDTNEKSLVVLDCATIWISNLLCGMGGSALSVPEIEKELGTLIQLLSRQNGKFRVVSNEVGLGIVPDNSLGRQFRDLQGKFNQSLASLADQVILMTAGIPQKIK